MRLSFLTGGFYPEPGGPSTFLYHFLPVAIQRGHQVVSLLTFGESRPADAEAGYPLTRISRLTGRVRRTLAYLRAAWRAAGTSESLFVVGFPVLLLPLIRLRTRRIVHKVVGDWSWEMADRRGLTRLDKDAFQTAPKPLSIRLLRAYYLWAVRHADLIITPSVHIQRIVMGWGIAPEKIRVIYNAIPEPELPTEDRRALREMLGLPLDVPLILSVARLTPVKGVQVMIEAIQGVPGAQFVVVGDGPQQGELTAAAASTGRVTFVGAQPHERVLMYMRAADVYVLSSFTEGLSHTLLEAIAVGTPVVATAVGGNPEVITDGVEGLLIPPGDPAALAAAVRRILSDPALAAQMGLAGLHRSTHFQWDSEVDATLAALTSGN